jgi:hypothetical protein
MAYNAAKPDAGDAISASQSVIKDNFTAIKALVDVNHVTFGLADQGKHAYVTMPQQTSFPTIGATEWSFFSATDGSNIQLYLRNNSSAGTIAGDINLTGGTFGTAGKCTLPCGLVMQWGTDTLSGTTSSISFGTAFSTACYNVQVTPTAVPSGDIRDGFVAATSISTSGFTAARKSAYSGTNCYFNWFAIGK